MKYTRYAIKTALPKSRRPVNSTGPWLDSGGDYSSMINANLFPSYQSALLDVSDVYKDKVVKVSVTLEETP